MKQSVRGSWAVAVALAIATCALPAVARADAGEHLAAAQQALAGLRYEQALHALEKALYAGKSGVEDMKTIYRMMGEIQAALGSRRRPSVTSATCWRSTPRPSSRAVSRPRSRSRSRPPGRTCAGKARWR